jgi:DNA polymerase-1
MTTPNPIRDDAVFLIDGSGYIFRAYYAVRPLTSSKGVPTNAVYGFTSMLIKLLREHKPRYLAIAFDTGKPTFRHEMYAGYKANRPPPPEDLIPQFGLIHQVVDAFRIKRLLKEGFEADDLIGTVARQARELGHQVVIVTGDKDFMQLVDDDVFLLDELRASKNGTELLVDRQQVINKFGVPPENVVDILALAGDSSDNVPGVRGIGEKTAIELVQEFGSVESILNAAPTITQKARRERLIEGHDMALLSKQLVTINCRADVDVDWPDMLNKGPSKTDLQALFTELDFKRWAQDSHLFDSAGAQAHGSDAPIDVAAKPVSTIDRSRYVAVITSETLHKVASAIKATKRLAVDTETDSLDPMQANLVGISLSWATGEAAYIPVGHDFGAAPQQLPLKEVIEVLSPLLSDASRTIIAQNAKYDQQVLLRAGFAPFHIGGDPMLASYLLEADNARHNLDDMSKTHLGHSPITFEEVCGKGKTKILFSGVPLERAVEYSAEDADVAYRLADILETRLKDEGLDSLYRTLELPLEEVLCEMERRGVRIDTKQLGAMSHEFTQKLAALEKQAHEIAGMEFNLASPKQVADVLFGKLGLDPVRKTKTGQSTDSEVLEELAPLHPLPKLLLEHRLISKLKGTYIDALPKLVNPKTGRVHTSFNQAVAATGRLSSSDPNLQNIPIRSPEGRRIREAFVADEGKVLISLDYSQIELRILAAVSKDPVMLDAFNQGEDVHQRTASEVFDVPLHDVTKEQRSFAKTINFGLLYGMGVHRLSQTLGISRAEASTYLNRYNERYAGIYEWQKSALERARSDQEVRTLLGRRRKLPEIRSQNKMLVQRAERVAINTPIQGTAADIIKKAMIETNRALRSDMPSVEMLLQVHDELLLESPIDLAAKATQLVQKIMCDACELPVPIVVDCGQGHSWAQAH